MKEKVKVVVVGGGWAGCAAAYMARKKGAQVILIEKTDMLLGTGIVGGIMRNNGRLTVSEEFKAMGAGELFQLCDDNSRHKDISFPGHEHAWLYDVVKMPGAVLNRLKQAGVMVELQKRITKVEKEENRIKVVESQDGKRYEGDVFIDASGSAGPMSNCIKYGNGCAMCVLRCPSFGGRVSLTALAGIEEKKGKRMDGTYGAMSGSCKLLKESLAEGMVKELNEKGVVVIAIPEVLKENHLGIKACQQYNRKEFADNIILLDTGHAKMMAPFFPLEKLRKIPGFEHVRIEDPYAGGVGNSIRFLAIAPTDETLQVKGVDNMFCAGEKVGLMVGHTEAIITGTLAGYNSVLFARGEKTIILPSGKNCTAAGEAIAYVMKSMNTEEGLLGKYTFSGSVLWQHLVEQGLYITDVMQIQNRVEKLGCQDLFR